MGWIEPEAFRAVCPDFVDVFEGREAVQRLKPFDEVAGQKEVGEVPLQLVVGFVVIAGDGRFPEGAVHALDLAVGPGVVQLGEPTFDAMGLAEQIEGMGTPLGRWPRAMPR